jgi:uncharacterized protein
MSVPADHLALVMKATRQCTLRCAYCTDWRAGPEHVMTFPVVARVVANALSRYDHINFIWHGGEPTLLPVSFYEKALLLQGRLQRTGQWVGNSFQTNATQLTPEWARFFHNNEIQVGVSIDGPEELHNGHRSYPTGKPSFQDVIRGLKLLKEYAVDFSGLVVVDEATLKFGARNLFDFLVTAGVLNFGLLAVKPRNSEAFVPSVEAPHYVDPTTLTPFLLDLYDAWRSNGDPSVTIRELEGLKAQILGQESGFCTLSGECWGHYLMIEPDGTVVACDVFSGDDRYVLGSVMTSSFQELASGVPMLRLREAHRASLDAMKNCPEFAVCRGWCPHERYASIRHNRRHQNECCGLCDLIAAIRVRMAEDGEQVCAPC